MAYDDNYSERIEFDESAMTDAQRIVVEGFLREGEFTTRQHLIRALSRQISEYIETSDERINQDWIDGVNYCIHVIRETDPFHA